ncbi:MAG TPA: HAD-IA family hydrolase [Jatrophihabitans sp.]|nr:HAD-IA family hydrolase [Jatrophihabitans sp.]
MPAVLFGSINTLTDISELQRDAFTRAIRQHGLDWQWDDAEYRASLTSRGGAQRITAYAHQRAQQVDADAVYRTETELVRQRLAGKLQPRPGVVETIAAAKDEGIKLGLVTTASQDTVAAVLAALSPHVRADDFDVVVDGSAVHEDKPDRAAYERALQVLEEEPVQCVAIEDNVGGVLSAHSAAIACVAFPNENTAGHNFEHADRRVQRLDLAELVQLIGAE